MNNVLTQILAKYGDLYVLSVCQPYASALIWGPKRIENRTWYTKVRGPIIIHAGKSRAWMGDYEEVKTQWPRCPAAEEMPFGRILGVVTMAGCVHEQEMNTDLRKAQDKWICGPYCFRMESPEPFPEGLQAPVLGSQGFFRISAARFVEATPAPAKPRPEIPGLFRPDPA